MESTPQDLRFAAGSPSAQPLAQAWMQLLDTAQESIHVASYYWSLTGSDIGVNDSSSHLVCASPTPLPPPSAGGPLQAHCQLAAHPSDSELWAVWVAPGEGWVLPGGRYGGLAWAWHSRLCLQGEALLQKLQQLLDRNISLAVATSYPTLARNSTDLQVLATRGRCLPCNLCARAGVADGWSHGEGPCSGAAVGRPGNTLHFLRTMGGRSPGLPAPSFRPVSSTKAGWFQGAGSVPFHGAQHRVALGPAEPRCSNLWVEAQLGSRGSGHHHYKGGLWTGAAERPKPVNASVSLPVKWG